MDIDPQRACAMCDSIISFLDDKIRQMHKLKYEEVVQITRKDYDQLSHQIDSIEQRLNILRAEYGIVDYSAQAEEITKGMVKVLADQKINTSGGKKLENWFKNFTEKGGEFVLLDHQQKLLVVRRSDMKKLLDEAISDANKNIIYGQKVQSPVPADKKSYPLRWLIVIVSLFSTMFVAILVVLFLENKSNIGVSSEA
jgi:hypothetical protein